MIKDLIILIQIGTLIVLWIAGAIVLRLSLANPGFADCAPFSLIGSAVLFLVVLGMIGVACMFLVPRSWKNRIYSNSAIKWITSLKGMAVCAFIPLLLITLLPALASWINNQPLPAAVPRLLVLGLDGATWDLIDPMMQSGELPTFQRLCANGARGELLSLEPMQSPDLWTSIATGLPPEKHGIEGYFCTRADLKANRVWDIANREGIGVGLFSWLVTWPPRDSFSFLIPAWMAHTPETLPSEYACLQEIYLEQSLRGGPVNPLGSLWDCARLGARLSGIERLAVFYGRDTLYPYFEEERLAAKLMAEMRMQTDLFMALLRRFQPGVAAFVLYGSDKIAHRFWHYMEPDRFPDLIIETNHPNREVIRDYYRRADEEFGRLLRALPPETMVLLISDHGFNADPNAPRQFFLDVPRLLEAIGVSRLVHFYTIQRRIVLEPVAEVPGLLESIAADLEEIRFSGGDEPVFQVEIEEGKQIALQPQFSLSWHEESPLVTHASIVIQGNARPVDRFFFTRTFSGTHDPRGIAIVNSPATPPGAMIENANLLDLAPTMLYWLGLPLSRELPGRIITEAFHESYLTQNPARYVDSYGDPPVLREEPAGMPEPLLEHLRSLDYVK